MNAFRNNIEFEQRFTDDLCGHLSPLFQKQGAFLARHARGNPKLETQVDRDIQKRAGDFTVYDVRTSLKLFSADLKVERQSWQNMFFETHSNYVLDPARVALGWGFTLEADRIWYAFADSGLVAGLDLRRLRSFLDGQVPSGRASIPRLERFRGVQQAKHVQANRTFGRLVPWVDLPKEVWRACFFLKSDETCECGSRERFLSELETVLASIPVARCAA